MLTLQEEKKVVKSGKHNVYLDFVLLSMQRKAFSDAAAYHFRVKPIVDFNRVKPLS